MTGAAAYLHADALRTRDMDRAQRATLVATVLGSGLGFLDLASVNVLLPVLQREFSTTIAAVQWVVQGFTLFLASLLLVGGALGDRFGRRRVFMIGVTVYALGAVAAAAAPSITWLIGMRLVQGVGAALLVPGSLALIRTAFSPEERGGVYGLWAAMTGVTGAGGPVVAGFLADTLTWRAFFLVSIPVAAAVVWALSRVPESRHGTRRIDAPGAVLATLGLGGITFGLVEGNVRGFGDALVIAALVTGVLALGAFLLVEARVRDPMMPLGLFRERAFAGMNAATLLVYAALSGALFFVPFNLIHVQGWSATAAGAAPLPFAVTLILLARRLGRLADRIGPRWPTAIGGFVAAAGYVLLARPGTDAAYWPDFFPGFLVLGLGMAALVPALTSTVMSVVAEANAGIASGVNNAIARTAGVLAIAVLGVVAVQVFAAALPADARDALGDDVASLAEAEAPPGHGQGVVDAAFVTAYRVIMLVAAALAAAGALLCAWTAPRSGAGGGASDG